MTAREQAEQLRQQAIQTLLEEKKAIDGMLRTLSHNPQTKAAAKKRGRPCKQEAGGAVQGLPDQVGLSSVQ